MVNIEQEIIDENLYNEMFEIKDLPYKESKTIVQYQDALENRNLQYKDGYRVMESLMSEKIGNHWQAPKIQSEYATEAMYAMQLMQGILSNINARNLLTGTVEDKVRATNKQYMTLEDIDSCYISDLDSGAPPFNNKYYKMYPHKHNPNKQLYTEDADLVPRKFSDRFTSYLGSPSYVYTDRLLSVDLKGYNRGREFSIRIRVPKAEGSYRDIDMIRISTLEGNQLILVPICKYGQYWIYNSFNKNKQMLRSLQNKHRTNQYKYYNRSNKPQFDENGQYTERPGIVEVKESIIKVEPLKLRINTEKRLLIEPDTEQKLTEEKAKIIKRNHQILAIKKGELMGNIAENEEAYLSWRLDSIEEDLALINA
jgi:hypothetical protein